MLGLTNWEKNDLVGKEERLLRNDILIGWVAWGLCDDTVLRNFEKWTF